MFDQASSKTDVCVVVQSVAYRCIIMLFVLFEFKVKSSHLSSFLQEKVLRMMYVWALCRDQEELNPYAAWRLLDISASSTEQIL